MQPQPPIYNEDAAQPREARDSLPLKAHVTEVGSGRRFTVRVRNLSSGGIMADRDAPNTLILDLLGGRWRKRDEQRRRSN